MTTGRLSPARLSRMHDVMAGHVERGTVPGLVTAVSRRGETHVDAIGSMAVGGSEPMPADAIFRISSMTKPVTAVAALILIEECVIRLDEPIDRFVPELADRRVLRTLESPIDDTVPAVRPITVRDLLTFRLGHGMVMAPPGSLPIVDAIAEAGLAPGPPRPAPEPDGDEWIRRLGRLPLLHQPGERWLYNTGSDVLGLLIARASGQPFDVFLRQRIFEPLGMVDTGFTVPEDQQHRLPPSYATGPDTGELALFDPGIGSAWGHPPGFPLGGSGLVSTVADYLLFAQMLLDLGQHGDQRLLARPSVLTMTTNQLTPTQRADSDLFGFFEHHGWGFGVGVTLDRHDPSASPGRYGWDGGLGTSWWNDPAEELVTILMTQAAWSSPMPPDVCADFWTSAAQTIDD